MDLKTIAAIDRALEKEFLAHPPPVVELVEAQTGDPFCVLVATILSARTKDVCTAGAVRRLFAAAKGRRFAPEDLERIPEEELSRLIYPVGFYRDKAKHLKALPAVLRERFGGTLPRTVEELCELPGVGRKTANLVVSVGFDLPAICVDVHVHRISNRLGIVRTRTPFETEMALRKLLPVKYWKTWNSRLVGFGQTRCGPVRTLCGDCPVARFCPSRRTAGFATIPGKAAGRGKNR